MINNDKQEVITYNRNRCPDCKMQLEASDYLKQAKHCPYCKHTLVLARNFAGTVQVVLADNCPNVEECPLDGIRELNPILEV